MDLLAGQAGMEQPVVARPDGDAVLVEERLGVIDGDGIAAVEQLLTVRPGDVEHDAPGDDGRDRLDPELVGAPGGDGREGVDAVVEAVVEGDVVQGVEMRADRKSVV